jgi:hypothetical protein
MRCAAKVGIMAARRIDYASSTITVRTRAKGLLSKLAHDLELEVEGFEGDVEVDDDRVRGTLRVPVRSLRVVGALKGGRVDRDVLSTSDVAEIERRMREALSAGEVEVKLEGTRERVQATVTAPRGSQRVSASVSGEPGAEGETVGRGKLSLSLRALGVKEIKAPLGAFKVDDSVEVAFRFVLAAQDGR